MIETRGLDNMETFDIMFNESILATVSDDVCEAIALANELHATDIIVKKNGTRKVYKPINYCGWTEVKEKKTKKG